MDTDKVVVPAGMVRWGRGFVTLEKAEQYKVKSKRKERLSMSEQKQILIDKAVLKMLKILIQTMEDYEQKEFTALIKLLPGLMGTVTGTNTDNKLDLLAQIKSLGVDTDD